MKTYSINTAEAIENFENAGIKHDHAKVIVETFAETQEELVTKDFLEQRLDSQSLRIRLWMITGVISTVGLLKALEYLGV